MKLPNCFMVGSLALCMVLTAKAEVFVRVDASGNTTYTNLKQDGMDEPQPSAQQKSSEAPQNFPERFVAPQVQNVRDQKRRDILQTELNSELALLKSDVTPANRVTHQQNIELIRKELAR